MKVLTISSASPPSTQVVPISADLGDVETHIAVAAAGTNALTATAVPIGTAVTVAAVTVSPSNTGVHLSGTQAAIGSTVEIYSTGGSVTVYTSTIVSASDSPPPFINGDLVVTVTSGAMFKRMAAGWAYIH